MIGCYKIVLSRKIKKTIDKVKNISSLYLDKLPLGTASVLMNKLVHSPSPGKCMQIRGSTIRVLL